MHLAVERFKEFLLDSGLVSRVDVETAEKEALVKKVSLGQVLISMGKIAEGDLRRMEAYLLGIPFIDLHGMRIDFDTLSIIPEPIARKHNIIVYHKKADALEVAMLDPQDLEAIEFVHKKIGKRILPRLTDSESIKNALLQYQKSLKAEVGSMIEKEAKSVVSTVDGTGATEAVGEDDLKKLAEDLPIVRIVETLLNHAIVQNASDIHIEPGEKDLLVRYRIDGILHDAMVLPRSVSPGIIARIKVLSNLRLDEKRLPQDGRFKVEMADLGQKVSIRVSLLPTFYGEKVVMRLLAENSKGFTLETLGFHGEALERIHSALKATTGILLSTGPTGSGKTTTLYTLLDIINTPQVNISTIEDPVEYQMPRVNQTQVQPEIGLTFAAGLRSLLRQDPNIIMVGEVRDGETAGLAINAALTGHLVLSTLHTNSAAGSVPRLIDMGAEPCLLSSTVNLVISQRLVRKLCSGGEKYFLSPAEIENLKKHANLDRVLAVLVAEKKVKEGDTFQTIPFFRPVASPTCSEGFSGRVVVSEVMRVTSAIKELILSGASSDKIEEQSRADGMLTMFEDGIYQAAIGVTSLEEVFRVAMTEQ